MHNSTLDLKENNAIEQLNSLNQEIDRVILFNWSELSTETATKLCDVLQNNPQIKTLELFGISTFPGNSIVKLIEGLNSSSLTTLNLANNQLKTESAKQLFTKLKDNRSIKILDLSLNNITEACLDSFSALLNTNHTLESISFRSLWNPKSTDFYEKLTELLLVNTFSVDQVIIANTDSITEKRIVKSLQQTINTVIDMYKNSDQSEKNRLELIDDYYTQDSQKKTKLKIECCNQIRNKVGHDADKGAGPAPKKI